MMQDMLQQLEALAPEGIGILERLVNLESPTLDKVLVDRLGAFVSTEFERLGGSVTRTPEEGIGDHLTIDFPGGGDRPIMLLGHLDTVWPEGEIRKRPFTVEDGIATGPGVFDMKGGIATMWMALRAILEIRGGLPNSVQILLTSNEEIGSAGSRSLVQERARRARAVLVLEPPLPDGVLKTVRNGLGRFTVTALGREAHTGVNPAEGVNSIEEMAHQVMRLQALGAPERQVYVTVSVIRGGTRPNVVPAETMIQVDARAPSQSEATRITRAIQSLSPVLPGSKIAVTGGFRRPPLERTPQNARLFEIAHQVAADLGHELREGATGGASDGNLTSHLGIPTLDGLGPVGHGAHQRDEQVALGSLPWRAALVAGLIERIGTSDRFDKL
jgi:glutamate carboxypeptidase